MHRFFLLPDENVKDNNFVLIKDVIPLITEYLSDQEAGKLAQTCKITRRYSFKTRQARFVARMYEFLDAVMNGHREAVAEILNRYPKLLKFTPPSTMVIENRLTWQKFLAEDALTIVVLLKQMTMMKLLLSCYDKLDQNRADVMEAKSQALSKWQPYQITDNPKREIIIPDHYTGLAQELIEVFRHETFPNGIPGKDNHHWNIELSEVTELALQSLLDRLVPKNAVKIDQQWDVELFLLAAQRAHVKNYESFKTNNDLGYYEWDKLELICIRFIGLVLSSVQRETAECYCQGIDDIDYQLRSGREPYISEQAARLTLAEDEDFYRPSRSGRVGHGFEFLCGTYGTVILPERETSTCEVGDDDYLNNYLIHKQDEFGRLCGNK